MNRVRFEPDKLDDVADSITRENMRTLIKNGSKKGKKSARTGKKQVYVIRVRAMRHHLKVLKDRNDITRGIYWGIYKKVNGGQVRSLAHLRELVKQSKIR